MQWDNWTDLTAPDQNEHIRGKVVTSNLIIMPRSIDLDMIKLYGDEMVVVFERCLRSEHCADSCIA